jgi:peptidoglycan/xylan/chitin deacetylase (PgdA/CDA1 family)
MGGLAASANSVARELVALGLRMSGLPSIIRRVNTRDRVTIVMYHDPRPATLDRHLAYMAKRYRFITLDHLVDALHAGDFGSIPPRSLVVTVDDGLRGNRHLGDVFRKHGCRPTVYVCTGIVGTRRRFWFQTGPLEDLQGLKQLPHGARLRELRERVGFEPDREYPDDEPQALDAEDLRAMRTWADLQSHTRFHPILTTCDDRECEEEISESRYEVERLSQEPCRHFCYPNGSFGEREIELVRKAGYRSARCTDFGWNGVEANPYRLRVAGASDDASVNILAVQLACITPWLRSRISRGRRRV